MQQKSSLMATWVKVYPEVMVDAGSDRALYTLHPPNLICCNSVSTIKCQCFILAETYIQLE